MLLSLFSFNAFGIEGIKIEAGKCSQVGCGGISVDYLATVSAFPRPDDKIRSTSSKVRSSDEFLNKRGWFENFLNRRK